MSYVYIRSEPELYTVGFYKPDGTWESESDHSTRAKAAARVHYLNGGVADELDSLNTILYQGLNQ